MERSQRLHSKIKCYNCDGIGHIATECRKPKTERSTVLITRKAQWADSSDSDEEVNYALVANANDSIPLEEKVPQTTFAFDTDDISELRKFLKCMHVSYRDQTLENERIKIENEDLKKRNDHLEAELILMLEIQKERDDAIYVKQKLLKKA